MKNLWEFSLNEATLAFDAIKKAEERGLCLADVDLVRATVITAAIALREDRSALIASSEEMAALEAILTAVRNSADSIDEAASYDALLRSSGR